MCEHNGRANCNTPECGCRCGECAVMREELYGDMDAWEVLDEAAEGFAGALMWLEGAPV